MCLFHGHKTVTLVRLEPTILLSRVKHSTTEPLCSTFCKTVLLRREVVWVLLFMCGFCMFVLLLFACCLICLINNIYKYYINYKSIAKST